MNCLTAKRKQPLTSHPDSQSIFDTSVDVRIQSFRNRNIVMCARASIASSSLSRNGCHYNTNNSTPPIDIKWNTVGASTHLQITTTTTRTTFVALGDSFPGLKIEGNRLKIYHISILSLLHYVTFRAYNDLQFTKLQLIIYNDLLTMCKKK